MGEKRIADVSNAQVFIQKVDGAFQFFLDAGAYSFPTVGVPYTDVRQHDERHLRRASDRLRKVRPERQLLDRGRKAPDPHRRRVRLHL
jgi:hypothetical protein